MSSQEVSAKLSRRVYDYVVYFSEGVVKCYVCTLASKCTRAVDQVDSQFDGKVEPLGLLVSIRGPVQCALCCIMLRNCRQLGRLVATITKHSESCNAPLQHQAVRSAKA